MSYNIVLTTADDVVAVIDAVNAKGATADIPFISEFTGIGIHDQVVKALEMSVDLQIISDNAGTYSVISPLGRLLATATLDEHKASIMRVILEQYEPFEVFKARYAITQNIDLSCKQIKALYSMSSNERDIKNTIISIATYAKILKRAGTSTYTFSSSDSNDHLQYIDEAIEIKTNDELLLRSFLGDSVYQFADPTNVITPLLDSVTKSKCEPLDTKAVIQYAGSAFESFLDQYAQHKEVSLQGKTGIISKLTVFNNVVISKKHRGAVEYIGQIRNAATHGSDANENNMTWSVSRETAIMYPMIVASTIKNILQRDNGVIEV